MMRWLRHIRNEPRVFLNHGEEDRAAELAAAIEREFGWPVQVSFYEEEIELNGGPAPRPAG